MSARRQAAGLAALALALGAGAAVAWTGDGAAPAPRTGPGDAVALDGAALFRAKGCAVCHSGPGIAASAGVGPDLTSIADRAEASYIRRSILDPAAVVAGAGTFPMPRLEVGPAEADALVAYLLAPGD